MSPPSVLFGSFSLSFQRSLMALWTRPSVEMRRAVRRTCMRMCTAPATTTVTLEGAASSWPSTRYSRGLRGWAGLGRAARPGQHLRHAHAGPDSQSLRSEQTAVAPCARVTVPVCASRFGTWCPRAELVKSEVPPLCLHGAFREPRTAGVVPSTYKPVIPSSMEDLLGRREDRG